MRSREEEGCHGSPPFPIRMQMCSLARPLAALGKIAEPILLKCAVFAKLFLPRLPYKRGLLKALGHSSYIAAPSNHDDKY